MGTYVGAHKVTMCNNSGHIKKRTAHQVSDVNKKQLIGKHKKRQSTCVSVYNSRDFSVPTRNKFASLVVEPSSEESPDMADIDLVVAHSQVNDTGIGLNLSAFDYPLQTSSYMADSSLVVAQSHTTDANVGFNCLTADPSSGKDGHVTKTGLVVGNTQTNDTDSGLKLAHNNSSVKDAPYASTACDMESIVEKAKKQIGTAFSCLPLSTIKLFTGDSIYYDKIPYIIETHRLVRQSGVPNFLGLRIPISTQLKVH